MTVRDTSNAVQAQHTLRQLLPEGATAYTVLRAVSRSGMLRRVSVLVATEGRVADVTGLVALALGTRRDTDGYLPVRGCGFSVATHVVGGLSWALYQDEYRLRAETL